MVGAPGTGRNTPIGPVRATSSDPVMTWNTPSSSSAAEASMLTMRACGYGQRPIAISATRARFTSSANCPAPRSRRSSSLRGTLVPITVCSTVGVSSRVSRSVIAGAPFAGEIGFDGIHDELVAGAPAQDAGQFLADLGPGALAPGRRERRGRHEERGRAEAALQGVVGLEALLKRAERPVAGGQRLDGPDL